MYITEEDKLTCYLQEPYISPMPLNLPRKNGTSLQVQTHIVAPYHSHNFKVHPSCLFCNLPGNLFSLTGVFDTISIYIGSWPSFPKIKILAMALLPTIHQCYIH